MNRIKLNPVDRERLAALLGLAEKAIGLEPKMLVPFTGEDIVLCQKLRKVLSDQSEYILISDENSYYDK